jgi:hypothetical protein
VNLLPHIGLRRVPVLSPLTESCWPERRGGGRRFFSANAGPCGLQASLAARCRE